MKDRKLLQRSVAALKVFSKTVQSDDLAILIEDIDERIADMQADEKFYALSKEARDRMKLAAKGNKNTWKPELDAPYQEAKKLVSEGMSVVAACKKTRLSSDSYYRRRRIEIYGRDKPNRYGE